MTPEQIFDRYHEAVYGFAYRLTGRPEMADDVTQDCFLAYLRAPSRFDPERGSLKTYLLSIARNLALKRLRDGRPEEPLDEEADLPLAPGPAETVDVASAVAQAVAALPPLQREALVLFEYEGATLEEIAAVAGVDSGAIKSRLHRARERLKKSLAAYRPVGKPYAR